MFTTLIVENSFSVRQFLKELLSMRFPSMIVEEAEDEKEALKKVHASTPNLIFMDIKLSGENGLELTRKIKRDYPAIFIIILTSFDLPEYRQAAYRYGADYFLWKGSLDQEKMLALVENLLSDVRSDLDEPTEVLSV
jgi:DNA-binding NarL/FixJ family response regulator